METKRELGSEFFLNARVDSFHVMPDDPKKALHEAIHRGNAYAEAGGDCIFYLSLHSAETIGTVAKEVQAPISILAGPQSPSVKELQDLGVARVSYGSGFMKAAITARRVGAGDFGTGHLQPAQGRHADAGDRSVGGEKAA